MKLSSWAGISSIIVDTVTFVGMLWLQGILEVYVHVFECLAKIFLGSKDNIIFKVHAFHVTDLNSILNNNYVSLNFSRCEL